MSVHLDARTLAAYVAGELDEQKSREVESHVRECGRCLAETDMAREFFSVPSGTDLGARSAELRGRFERQLALRARPRLSSRRPSATRRWALAAAAAAVVVAAIGVQRTLVSSGPPAPTGQLLSLPPNPDHSLSIENHDRTWMVHVQGAGEGQDLTLRVEDSAGRAVLESDRVGPSFGFGPEEFTVYDPDEVYFVRVFGRDSGGKRWIAGPTLLPRRATSTRVPHSGRDAIEGPQ